MNDFCKRLNEIMKEKGISSAELCRRTGIPKSAMSQYRSGAFSPKADRIYIIANALNVSEAWLLGYDVPMDKKSIELNPPEITTDTVTFPVIGDVAAGFDKVAIEDWTGDKILVPQSYLKGRNMDDFFVLRVKGSSMYPEYRDGDKVLVLKQNAVDYSGQIAVAIYDEELGTIKKIEYKKDSIHLVPINPQYEPEIIKGADIEKVHILGIPKLLIREIED